MFGNEARCTRRDQVLLTIVLRTVLAFYVVIIVVLSLVPHGPELGTGDKWAHFASYMLMAIIGMLLTSSLRSAVIMFLLIAAVGAALEGLQGIIPTRTPSGWDLVADLAGASAGTLVWLGFVKAQSRRLEREGWRGLWRIRRGSEAATDGT